MKEFENFLNANNIESDYHNNIFESEELEKIYSKINLKEFEKIRNQIYWLSLLIYKISFLNYFKSIQKDIDIQKNNILIKKNNIILFHPLANIFSEMCKQLKNNFIYTSLTSVMCRQIIEQICLVREIENENIEEKVIIEAAIESNNKHLGAKSLNLQDLNCTNKGLLKVFKNKMSYGKLANKYNYGFLYNFFSGDIHALSQIDKLIPFSSKNNTYYEIYLKCVLTLLRDCLLILSEYDNNELKINLDELSKIDFIDIKSNKK